MENELEPLNICRKHFWEIAIGRMCDNPKKVLPVYLKPPRFSKPLGDYFLHFVKEDGKVYLQAEGFSSKEVESGFVIGFDENLTHVQPGIYRLDITDYLGGDL